MSGQLHPILTQLVHEYPRHGSGVFNLDTVRAFMGEDASGRVDRAHILWAFLSVELWHRQYRLER